MNLSDAIQTLSDSALGSRRLSGRRGPDQRVMLVVTLLYIFAVLSIPVTDPASLLWLFCFPIIGAEACGLGYGRLLRRSLWVLPLVALVGVYNLYADRQEAFRVGGVVVTTGALTFSALLIRGLLAFQALLLLVYRCGFHDICRSLQWMRCPKVLVTQLLLLYRYIGVLLAEAQSMDRARKSRGFGRKSYPLRMWGTMAGQLLLRSMARARRVNAAMVSRGFNGTYSFKPYDCSARLSDWLYLLAWTAVFAALRFIDFTEIIGRLITR